MSGSFNGIAARPARTGSASDRGHINGNQHVASSPTMFAGSSPSSQGRVRSPDGGGGGGAGRPHFGTAQSYQRWSNTTPGFTSPNGATFSAAMQHSAAETLEVRREIEAAIESFLYRPVARRFAEEASKWVEDHLLPVAPGQSSLMGSGGRRPVSADIFSPGGGGGSGGDGSGSVAALRQRTLALAEEVLPLMFHRIALEIRDVVRLRIEAALLKRETRVSYL